VVVVAAVVVGAGATTRLNTTGALVPLVLAAVKLSCTEPAVVGVPEITPVCSLKLNPSGKFPVIAQEIGPSPLATSVTLYPTPAVALGMEFVLINGAEPDDSDTVVALVNGVVVVAGGGVVRIVVVVVAGADGVVSTVVVVVRVVATVPPAVVVTVAAPVVTVAAVVITVAAVVEAVVATVVVVSATLPTSHHEQYPCGCAASRLPEIFAKKLKTSTA
jgi:hypothetical protein